MREIIIPESVTMIGFNAFYECDSLVKVTIPPTIKTIGYNAFGGCMFLEKIIIPNAVDNVASISNIDITIPPKVFQRKIVLAGPDGVGKTSLIRVCAGMEFEYYSKDNLDNVNIDVDIDVNVDDDVFGGSVELQLVDSRFFW